MSTTPRKLPQQTLTELAVTADEQARHLNELTRWAFESGVEDDLTDDQIIALMRHQSAIATLLLTLTTRRANKA